ncbi:hypothetical protein [Micromonospora sp. NPDC051006]|uniref:hypothetical protein n=1 Tax=Micromonospora sp. NPDC051006 TaxID=3364283 RepID=UPI00379752F3
MQDQTLPEQYRIAFDVNAGVEPMTFPAGTTLAEVTTRLHHKFLLADVIDDGNDFAVTIDYDAGTVVVSVDGDVIEHGSIYREETKPDYWLTLADDLRQVADRIAALAGTPGKPSYVTFTVCAGLLRSEETSAVPMVDAIAEALSVKATTGDHNRRGSWDHRATATIGAVDVTAYANVTKPAEAEDHLRARIAELEAQLAKGGTR